MVCRQCIESVMACEVFVSLRKEVFLKTNIDCTSLKEGSGTTSGNWKQWNTSCGRATTNAQIMAGSLCLLPQQSSRVQVVQL